jgi:mannose-6-phosphate isomerase-like protein (cupin superfamily)
MTQKPDPPAGYAPSPRPTYDCPTLVTRAAVRRHVWGDATAGLVGDWLYASTQRLHVIVFGLAPGRGFTHSRAFRTVFGADELLHVLSGSMVAANPETGEMLACEAGESLFFRKDTWHHAWARGAEPLRVLEFFAPPPATGSSGPYAAQRPYVEQPRYTAAQLEAALAGRADAMQAGPTLRRLGRADESFREAGGGIRIATLATTEHLTVARVEVSPGAQGGETRHGGDALLYGLAGELFVRTRWQGEVRSFELTAHDAVFLPQGSGYELLSFGGSAQAMLGVAPTWQG